jgi:hypothetical protein
MKKFRWLRLLALGLIVFQTFAFGFKVNTALAAAPESVITSGPSGITASTTATFSFISDDVEATFECQVDSGGFSPCTSPFETSSLSYGPHVFYVQATNASLETDPSAASRAWAISPFDYGDGTIDAPFLISTCDQFMQMDAFPTSRFQLGSDIDCDGTTYVPIGQSTHFQGVLDGDGYTVKNVTAEGMGLFAFAEDAVVHDLIVRDSNFTSSDATGAVVGYADTGTYIHHVHVYNTNIEVGNGYSGGIVGFLGNSATLSQVSFVGGSVKSVGHNYIGGIAGTVELGTIQDAFSKTHLEGNKAGGIAGTVDYEESIITRVYSASTFDTLGTENGGLIGTISDGTVSHVFSASDMTVGGGTSVGAIFGNYYSSVTLTDASFDKTLANRSNCAGTGSPTCTARNTSGGDSNYFKNNSTHAPLDTWSFGAEGIWHVNYNDYPTLTPVSTNGFECTNPYRNLTAITTTCSNIEPGFGTNTWELQYKISADSDWSTATLADTHSGEMSLSVAPVSDYDLRVRVTNDSGTSEWLNMESNLSDSDSDGANDLVENNAPRAGDGNDDSQHDVEQANVYSDLNPVSGNFTTLVTSCDNNYNVQIGGESSEHTDTNYTYPEGLVGFIGRDCGAPGSTVNVELYFYGDYDASKFVLRKSSGTGTYTTIDNAILTSTTIGGQKVLKATYQVVDGGALDADGTADGNIVDPVGLAQSTITAPDTGLQHKSIAGSVFALAFGIIALAYVTKKEIFAGSLAK